MLKKTIKYTDFDGHEQEKSAYFNLTRTEAFEISARYGGDFEESVAKIVQQGDAYKMIGIIKDIILKAYGEREVTGQRFVKSERISREFEQSAAYDALFMELISDPEAMKSFINSVVAQAMKEAQQSTMQNAAQ